jgi:hypothetical protein
MCPSPSRNRRRASVQPLAARRKEMRWIGQAGATGVVAMAVWQAGRDHRAPSRRGILWSACCSHRLSTPCGSTPGLSSLTDEPGPPAEELHSPPAYLDGVDATAMAPTALEQFLAHVQADPALRRRVSEAITADEVSLLAQALGYPVSGSDLLRFSGRSAAGVRVTRMDHPGEYPGRYV